MLRVGIIGAGLIGGKRAAQMAGARLVAVADQVPERARALAARHQAEACGDWPALVRRQDVDAVVVATTNDALSACARAALEAGKHVLVEKPAGRNPADVAALVAAEASSGRAVRVGFNHRFHPGLARAKALVDSGDFGPLMHLRARYGHGGRLGYDREWRADPARAGGGELLDQGVHLIDLCRWIGGELQLDGGAIATSFWDMKVEDNGFLLLRSPHRGHRAWLHASCTEWKNLFDFEIFCRTAKLQVFGLGRSYGTEELRVYRMKPEMGPPDVEVTPFPGEDASWQAEWDAFLAELSGRSTPIARAQDALRAVELVHELYRREGAPWA
ncbi:MAG TPA: Gfo/Idh/MocA family oxidoreductase [Myxococcaceae bacterium]|nr:Gfo/Idh/MocA family oxidoreductase [Myxococcaceae bacterium]